MSNDSSIHSSSFSDFQNAQDAQNKESPLNSELRKNSLECLRSCVYDTDKGQQLNVKRAVEKLELLKEVFNEGDQPRKIDNLIESLQSFDNNNLKHSRILMAYIENAMLRDNSKDYLDPELNYVTVSLNKDEAKNPYQLASPFAAKVLSANKNNSSNDSSNSFRDRNPKNRKSIFSRFIPEKFKKLISDLLG